MNIDGHSVGRRPSDNQIIIDDRPTGYYVTGSYAPEDYEKWAADYDRQASDCRLVSEYRRRELAEQEQAARDAELDRRAQIAFDARYDGLSWHSIGESARVLWRDVIRALDADAAERGTDA